jgi:hypothetical protein
VFAALAVTRFTGAHTGWSIKKFMRTARCHHTIELRASYHIPTPQEPLPSDLHDALALIK